MFLGYTRLILKDNGLDKINTINFKLFSINSMKIFLISQAIKIVGIKGHISLHSKTHSNGLKVNIYVLFVVNLSHFKILAQLMLARLLSVKRNML